MIISKVTELIELIKQYTNNYDIIGIIFLACDILILLGLIILLFKLFKVKLKVKKLIMLIIGIVVIYGATYFLDFKISFAFLKIIAFWSIGLLIILYGQEIKHLIENRLHNVTADKIFASEEDKLSLVKTIVDSAEYLSERKIGALICIERIDSLDSLINKAIYIKGKVSMELLTSLFYTGSATHDGAVIIRKNNIMCAGAYLPSTEKYDVPKSLGTRHRAAIGLSEKYDAITVIVSEETGKISITVDGIIQQDLSLDKLKEKLSQYLISK